MKIVNRQWSLTEFMQFCRRPSALFSHFFIWQVLVITVYIGSRKREDLEPIFTNGLYLGLISISTLLLTIHLVFMKINTKLDLSDKLFITFFSLPSIVLYLSMFIHHDFASMQSLTLLFIFLAPIFIWLSPIDKKEDANFLKLILYFSVVNVIFSVLQYMQIMPVAQLNTRESLSTLIDRPTGLLFNAFAMSYAAIICLAIGLNQFLKNKKLNKSDLVIFLTSLIAIFLSGTRTSLWLTFLISISILLVRINIFSKIQTKAIPIILILIGAGAPFILLFIGSKTGNVEWATLNGRTQMWSCVDQKIGELIPLGVGLDEAFPPKFCADSGWFSNLRHPENMFLLSLVESGPLGFLSYVSLFIFTIWISIKAMGKNYILPLAITVTFLLSCLIYVSLFHYLPFLANRPADRGIFNFHFFYLVWIWVLRETKNNFKETDLSR